MLPLVPLISAALLATQPAQEDYGQLLEWRFAAQPLTIPEGGIRFERDTASWTLESGRVRLMQPIAANGLVTGFVFEGKGRFEMDVPDPVERDQLRRFTEETELERVDVPFDKLVLRTSDGLVDRLFPSPSALTFRKNKLARQRHEEWLKRRRLDVDARIVAALRDPGDSYLHVGMDTSEWGWLNYDFDSRRTEESRLIRDHAVYSEIWVSLDRNEDRAASGRPSGVREPVRLLDHIEVRADLTRSASNSRVGRSWVRPIKAALEVRTTVEPLVSGATAVSFSLHPRAKVESVRDVEGAELAFLRDHIGGRSISIDKKLYDDAIVVLLEQPLIANQPITLQFVYELEIVNFVEGFHWYPTIEYNHLDPHTARLELVTSGNKQAHSMGRLRDETQDENRTTTVWEVDVPTPMVTFVAAERYKEERIARDGLPEIISVGPMLGLTGGRRVRELCQDVADSVEYFQALFDARLDGDQLLVSSIAAGHGQSFEGFLQLPEATLAGGHRGATKLLRAHEVAHQWWGHLVRWRTYRDVWLSEAFAEYSAMMFVEEKVEQGDEYFPEILDAYQDLLNGSIMSMMSKFSRPGLVELSLRERDRVGPIDVGARAGTKDMPAGYFLQIYYKGPMVVHMMRQILRRDTGSDRVFIEILRDFLQNYRGRLAGTAELRAVVEEHTGSEWGWFFNQWVYGTDIPSYRWDYRADANPNQTGAYPLSISVERSDVDADFTMPIPIEVELATGELETFAVVVKQDSETFVREFAAPVEEVTVNDARDVLAKVRKN